MIKLFISDLDGTYLNGLHLSSQLACDTIDDVLKENKYFAMATGRHLHQNHRVGIRFFDKPIYKIAMNGAIIWDTNHHVIFEQRISPTFIDALNQTFPNVSFEWITKKGVLVKSSRFHHIAVMIKRKLSLKAIVKYAIAMFTKDYYFNQVIDQTTEVLMISCRIGDETLAQQVKQFILDNSEYVVDYGPSLHNFEIVAQGVNKQTASSWLAHRLGVDENQVAVYGNDLNDVPMLSYFQHSYAPDNAVASAKQAASQCIESNVTDGVAKHIRMILNNQKIEE